MTELRDSLQSAMRAKSLVKIKRTIPKSDELTGFVVGLSAKWTLLHLAEDTWLNGYATFKTIDIKSIKKQGSDGVTSRALEYYRDRPRRPTGVAIENVGELLTSANKRFSLVTIYTEGGPVNECYIGVVKQTNRRSLKLLEISASAEWSQRQTSWPLKEITRIDFGGRYERALLDLGGTPPRN